MLGGAACIRMYKRGSTSYLYLMYIFKGLCPGYSGKEFLMAQQSITHRVLLQVSFFKSHILVGQFFLMVNRPCNKVLVFFLYNPLCPPVIPERKHDDVSRRHWVHPPFKPPFGLRNPMVFTHSEHKCRLPDAPNVQNITRTYMHGLSL